MAEDIRLNDKVIALMEKGVTINAPHAVEIGDEVDVNRISGHGVVLHAGTKLFGSKTLIESGVQLGYEAPLTAVDCRIGSRAELRGGFCRDSLFLEGVSIGSGAQVREGCILEEGVRAGHTVGLKQTILFPFVTLGSLINFCDCLMAGGTSRKNHSEVGSSYIHFNYTPNQDKATPSLIGDVPGGVMVNQPPIFLGGQGGIVGPVRIGYGTVVRAGTILRKDSPEGGKLVGGGKGSDKEKAFEHGFYGNTERKVLNNVLYLANLLALRQWYAAIRGLFFTRSEFGPQLHESALEILDAALLERQKRLQEYLEGVERRPSALKRWSVSVQAFTSRHEANAAIREREAFTRLIQERIEEEGPDYLGVIQGLNREEASLGTSWLQSVVDDIMRRALNGINFETRRG